MANRAETLNTAGESAKRAILYQFTDPINAARYVIGDTPHIQTDLICPSPELQDETIKHIFEQGVAYNQSVFLLDVFPNEQNVFSLTVRHPGISEQRVVFFPTDSRERYIENGQTVSEFSPESKDLICYPPVIEVLRQEWRKIPSSRDNRREPTIFVVRTKQPLDPETSLRVGGILGAVSQGETLSKDAQADPKYARYRPNIISDSTHFVWLAEKTNIQHYNGILKGTTDTRHIESWEETTLLQTQ